MKFKLTTIILCVLLAVFALTGCGTPPSISNAHMTTAVDSNAKPVDEVSSYSPDVSQVVVSANISNIKKDTYVTFIWKYEGEKLYESKLELEGNLPEIYAKLKYDQLFPEGEYSVEIYIDDNKDPSQVVNFTIESASSIKITDAHMTTDVDSQGKPVDTVASYKTSSAKFTVSAIIRNAPNNTKITFIWFYKGSKITTAEVDSGNIADRYIYGYLTNTQAWPTGEYSVEIYINNNTSPASIVNFTVK